MAILTPEQIHSGKRFFTTIAAIVGIGIIGLYATNYADIVRNYWATFGAIDVKSMWIGVVMGAVLTILIRFIRFQLQR